jgi:lipoprotein-anchoring transpeptidase ErfK/SrfK
MKITRLLFTLLLLGSILEAKSIYFKTHDDVCESTRIYQCTNDYNTVRNLQITLNKDKKLDLNLKVDGKWGKETKEAVITFQKRYNLTHADGWVGKETKQKLDMVAKDIHFPKDNKVNKKSTTPHINYTTYEEFRKNVNIKKSYAVFQNKKLLAKSNRRNTTLKIDISDQRVTLIVAGKVALSSPCTTGARRKFEPNTKIYRNQSTPKGRFRIMEKIADKRSTIFGDMYRGNKRVYHGDRRKYRGKSARYVGASLKNWMRLTSSGIGLHASKYVKRYAGSNGCVRLPYSVSKTIFKKVRKGTTVKITQ